MLNASADSQEEKNQKAPWQRSQESSLVDEEKPASKEETDSTDLGHCTPVDESMVDIAEEEADREVASSMRLPLSSVPGLTRKAQMALEQVRSRLHGDTSDSTGEKSRQRHGTLFTAAENARLPSARYTCGARREQTMHRAASVPDIGLQGLREGVGNLQPLLIPP